MNGPGDINSGDRGKRGDMLRGILKIRRKRNKSVSKTSSRGLRLISDELCFVLVCFVLILEFLRVSLQVFPECDFLNSNIPPFYGEKKGLILMRISPTKIVQVNPSCFCAYLHSIQLNLLQVQMFCH